MMTPEEAKDMWCPFARVSYLVGDDTTYNRIVIDRFRQADTGLFPSANCVGPQCMAWRWSVDRPLHPIKPPKDGVFWRDESRLQELELSTRTLNSLVNEGITTVGAVRVMTDSQLMRLVNFGRKALREIRDAVGYSSEPRSERTGYCGLAGKPEALS